ncbi:hypothetical protein [Micromonospora sp. AMSO31t]|uniref:hypothetical protein n=1 Tax=Micromonospora sp. AMSO31t TaxID=2650566 RepID=UPI00124B113B|nr:hypothetical protein [Micromonospora sp. AMSO31t]KAB1912616.1 hypothetical protein F8274_13280 [Micromonospora sp. AMSO31t]
MGFGFKTTWLAVRKQSPEEVADALQLADRERLSWDEGVDRAYASGVYVAGPVDGWTLAHGRRDLGPFDYSAADPRFPEWLAALSVRLGEVQFFVNERGWFAHGWAWAVNGVVLRAFATFDGAVPLFVGDPTPAEHQVGKGLRGYADTWRDWEEEDWDAWYESAPNEQDVLKLAARWSVHPLLVDSAQVGDGIYGTPARAA